MNQNQLTHTDIIADDIIIPPTLEYQQHYTEKVIYMPHTYLPAPQAIRHPLVERKVTRDP